MEINQQAPVKSNHEIFINAAPETVWNILTDINRWSEWHPDIAAARLEGELKSQAVFKWKSGGFNIVSTVQEVAAPHRLGWTGKAFGTRAAHTWTLAPQTGGVLVTTAESFEGWLVGLMKGSVQKTLDVALKVWLESLKKKAEDPR